VQARQVANQMAICDVVKKYGVKKIFTFHSQVASAKSFVADTSEGIPSHLPGYLALHVNGEMSTADREKIIKEFKLPINITQYTKKSNAYVHFYNYMLVSRRWCTPKNSPYTNKRVIESMSGKFDMEYNTMSKEIQDIFTEEGF
jgi:hypothetical protein